ncbi:MAG: HAD domain-containing protein [Umezawaea sp.]
MTGLLLLDVDGPLNPYAARPHHRPAGYETFRRTAHGRWYGGRDARRHRGIRVWLRPDHGPWLLALAERTGLELVWATTWEHEANEHIGPSIGLPPLPVVEFPDRDPVHGWSPDSGWKWRAVLAYAAGRPLAWLDDEHDDPFHGGWREEFDRERDGIPTLLCHVDPRHGLGPEHLERVATWASGQV